MPTATRPTTTATASATSATRTTASWSTPRTPNDCLDPSAAFAVNAGGSITLKRGEALRLPLFANRNGAAIQYTWTVTSRPAGSSAAVENPKGAVTVSRHWQYAYVDGHVPTFTADVDGDYTSSSRPCSPSRTARYPSIGPSTAVLHRQGPGRPGPRRLHRAARRRSGRRPRPRRPRSARPPSPGVAVRSRTPVLPGASGARRTTPRHSEPRASPVGTPAHGELAGSSCRLLRSSCSATRPGARQRARADELANDRLDAARPGLHRCPGPHRLPGEGGAARRRVRLDVHLGSAGLAGGGAASASTPSGDRRRAGVTEPARVRALKALIAAVRARSRTSRSPSSPSRPT